MSGESQNESVEEQAESWELLRDLLHSKNLEKLIEFLETTGAGEISRAVSRLSGEERQLLFELLGAERAADLLVELPEEQAADLIEGLPEEQAADIVEEFDSDDQADILQAMESDEAEEILQRMDPTDAEEARQLISFDPNTAGGLMMTEYLSFPAHWKIGDILSDLEANSETYAGYEVLYGYVVDETEKLLGIIRFRDLLLLPKSTPVTKIMGSEAILCRTSTSLEDLEDLFDRYDFFAVPVVDDHNHLMGLVRRADVREALESRAEKTFLQASGILGGEEFRTMPLRQRSVRRLSVLTVNIGLNIVAASVIAAYQDTISQVIALAVFLPIISDLSGCSGNQAIAVSIRELALGLLKPHEFLHVFWKEVHVGLFNGVALGAILGVVTFVWKWNLALALVVGGALALNTVVSVIIGGSTPLLLKKWGLDPAVASSPVLTTVTDICGFFFVLSLASIFLQYIV